MSETSAVAQRIERLVPGNLCLHAILSKDLSYKYGRYFGEATTRKSEHNWCVAGMYDYLDFVSFNSLEEIPKADARKAPQVPWEDSRRLVIFPYADPAPSEGILKAMEDANPTEHPLLVLTRIALSPTAYEFGPGLGHVLRATANLISLLKAASSINTDLPEIAYFGSLSSPDLVTVALPKNPAELHAVHTFTRVARSLRLAELKECRFWADADEEDESSRVAQEYPGYACVMVTPTLAFRLGSRKQVFESASFKDAETKHGLRLNFRLRVDCGHEAQVVRDMRRNCGDDVVFPGLATTPSAEEEPWGRFGVSDRSLDPAKGMPPGGPVVASWDTHLIHGHFTHMATLAKTWEKLWFNDTKPNAWRSLNLLDSTMTVSMGDDVAGWHQSDVSWEIAKPVRHDLDQISHEFAAFAREFLNATQSAELRSIFNRFHSCFFRQDLLGTSRDLFPFFRQLGRALGDVGTWRRYLDPTRVDSTAAIHIKSDFDRGVQDLIMHVSRAVRNRIEHRSVTADPLVPQTLRDGACKVISAYTFIVHLCCGLFRGTGRTTASLDFDVLGRSAACVAAGTQGRVECWELFDEFRKFVEHEHQDADQPPMLLSQRKPEEWSSRLFMFDIPSYSVLRPDWAIVHCLHEIGELSEWIMGDRCSELRHCLNHWIIGETIGMFRHRIAEKSCRYPGRTDTPSDQEINEAATTLDTFATWFVPYCVSAHDLEQVNSAGQASTHIKSLVATQHPLDLVLYLEDAIYSVGSDPENLTRFAIAMEPSVPEGLKPLRPIGAHCSPMVASGEDLMLDLQNLRELTREVLGDIGMWCALHVLLATRDAPLAPDARFEHVAKTFRSVVVIAAEASDPRGINDRLQRSLLFRFAIQAAAALPPGTDYQRRILSSLCDHEAGALIDRKKAEDALAEATAQKSVFGDSDGLVARLRAFTAYGGDNDLGFPELWRSEDDRVVSAFRDAWTNPDSVSARLSLFNNIWAASTRFAIPRLFDRIEIEKGTNASS